jgi:hypothetical protein
MRDGFAATVAPPLASPIEVDNGSAPSSDGSHHGRFLPGSKVAERYRIVSLVGKGGMGEVYRADDLKLGQTVALKFLPREVSKDPKRLEYFLSEVRLTRQISHPNVCRVYDVGEFDGQHFLSMEYIDGEDLRVLLRRIGRLPHDKGVQIAQQLCAGLAAAHERGVLHRDLKPANIMIDGRGHVRITDFGLARLARETGRAEVAGTPAYMAPEQLTRGEATIQSDLFALGLILSEIFTGRAVLKAGSIPDLIRAHESSLSQAVTFTEDVDTTVQRVIRRCLEREPHDRPASARAVAAGLPGGDPLEAALAAGETPSPEMVAASGETGQLSLRTAGICLAILLIGLAGLILILGRNSVTIDLNRSADLYAEDARDVLEGLGHNHGEVYEDWGFAETKETPNRMGFWYRQSPQRLIPVLDSQNVRTARIAAINNPPPLVPGMVTVRLTGTGLLREFLIVPPSPDSGQDIDESVLWLLKQSELIARDAVTYKNDWTKVPRAGWTPPVSDAAYSLIRTERTADLTVAPADETVKATGASTVSGITQVNIAEFDGQIVFFHVIDTAAPTPRTFSPLKDEGLTLGPGVSVLVTLIAMVLAWRNVLAGRSDVRGGRWLALFVFAASFTDAALESVFTPGVLFTGLLLSLAASVRFWIYYVALEPLARRYWPEMLVNWSRGLAGRVQDPGIGREILYGMLTAILFTVFAFGMLGVAPAPKPQTLCGTRYLIAELADSLRYVLVFSLQIAIVMVLVRVVARNKWLPVMAAACFAYAWHPNFFEPAWSDWDDFRSQDLANIVAYTMYYATAGVLIARLGLLAASSFMLCHGFFRFLPWTADLAGPDLPGTVLAVIAILICALYGFYTSVGGPSTFRDHSMNAA